ncbi:MAG: AAA family ATPase [Rickettsiales bacterium]|nr:AAA family ATPase [Rickettsiales bacterium]
MENKINKINYLKNFGSFKEFEPKKPIEFKKMNIFYGYNGSGKTTLTRFFDYLNGGIKSQDYSNVEYKINDNIKNIENSPFRDKIEVFLVEFFLFEAMIVFITLFVISFIYSLIIFHKNIKCLNK